MTTKEDDDGPSLHDHRRPSTGRRNEFRPLAATFDGLKTAAQLAGLLLGVIVAAA